MKHWFGFAYGTRVVKHHRGGDEMWVSPYRWIFSDETDVEFPNRNSKDDPFLIPLIIATPQVMEDLDYQDWLKPSYRPNNWEKRRG